MRPKEFQGSSRRAMKDDLWTIWMILFAMAATAGVLLWLLRA